MRSAISLALLLGSLSLRADPPAASDVRVSGHVVDRDGVALRGVSIELQGARKVEATTGDDGEFSFEGIRPGVALVVAWAPGFERTERSMEVGRAPIVLSNLVLRRLPGRASLAVSAADLASRGTRTTIALFGEQSGRVLLREAPQGQAVFDVDPGLYSLAAVRCCGEGFAIPFYHAICLPGLHLVGVRTLQLAFYGVNGKDLPRDAQGRAVPVTATEACRSAFASGRMASGATASKGELIGAILDESGGFVMDATVVLRDQRTSVERPVRMSPTGFRLTATPGQYQIRASAPHTGEIRAVVDLREGEQTWWFPRMGPRTGP